MGRKIFASVVILAMLSTTLFSAEEPKSSVATETETKPTAVSSKGDGESSEGKSAKTAGKKGMKKGERKAGTAPELTAEQEASTLAFVKTHNAKVLKVLDNLKAKKPEEYTKAIGELFAAAEAIRKFEGKDQGRFELELKAWKLKSESELLAARIRRAALPKRKDTKEESSEKLESELKALLAEQIKVQIEIQTLQRDRLGNRLTKMNEEIERLRSSRDATVDARYRRMVQRPGKQQKVVEKQANTEKPKAAEAKNLAAPISAP